MLVLQSGRHSLRQLKRNIRIPVAVQKERRRIPRFDKAIRTIGD
jgi:hypothetical protein